MLFVICSDDVDVNAGAMVGKTAADMKIDGVVDSEEDTPRQFILAN